MEGLSRGEDGGGGEVQCDVDVTAKRLASVHDSNRVAVVDHTNIVYVCQHIPHTKAREVAALMFLDSGHTHTLGMVFQSDTHEVPSLSKANSHLSFSL